MKSENKKNRTRTKQIHVRLTPLELEQVAIAAQSEHRTLSDYLVVAGIERIKIIKNNA